MLLLITNVITIVIKLVINNIWPYMATYTYAYMAAYKWYCYCSMFWGIRMFTSARVRGLAVIVNANVPDLGARVPDLGTSVLD